MELGSIAEWLTGISELLAVSVALFLPMIANKKNEKNRAKKLVSVALNMAKRCVNEKEDEDNKKIQKLSSYQNFKQYITIVSIIVEDPETLTVLNNIDTSLLSIKKNNSNILEVIQSIEKTSVF